MRGIGSRSQAHFLITLHAFISETLLNLKSHNSDCSRVFDTAVTHHFFKDRSHIWNYESLKNESMAVAVDGVSFPIEGKGNVKGSFRVKSTQF